MENSKKKSKVLEIILIIAVAFFVWAFLLPILVLYHEIGHATIARVFGIRIIEITPSQVVMEEIENDLIALIIRLSGGFFQALLPILIFVITELIIRKYPLDFIGKYRRVSVSIIGLEIALITHGIYGVVNGIVEGFFPDFYAISYSDTLLWGSVFFFSGIIASIWSYKRWHFVWSLGISKQM